MSLNVNESGEVKSRMQKRELKKKQKATLVENMGRRASRRENNEDSESSKKIRTRLIPIWLRIIIIAVLFVLFVIIGAVIGYSVIGDGSFTEVFQKSTWTNIFDLVEKE